MGFINKMDRMGADFYADLAAIHERLTPNAVPIQLPIGAESNFKGIIDLFTRKATVYKDDLGKDFEETDVPADMKEKVEEYRHSMVEKIAEQDDALLQKYLDNQEIGIEDLKRVLRKATVGNKLMPILVGSALKNKGVQPLLDAVVDYLPSPMDVPAIKGKSIKGDEEIECPVSDDAPFAALAFKVATDPFVGTLTFFRVYSGVMKSGSYVLNASNGNQERVGRILRMHANHREDVNEVYSGEIAAAVGLKNTTTGDTLCDPNKPLILESITFPDPVISVAIEPKTKVDQERMGMALAKLAAEDPTFKIRSDEETGQTVIWGMGELHLEIIVDRMKREFKVEANVGRQQVAYKETIKGIAEAEGKYIRQSGGRGQYGHCVIRVEPMERGAGYEFVDEVKGGNIPKEYIVPINKGIKEALDRGVLAHYPMVDVKATVLDGSYHDVDSSESAFKIAGSMALQAATKKASPILLEPIMKVEVVTPEKSMGDVIGDLNSKRATIKEMRDRGMMKVIDADVPLAEMFGYATALRSMSQGRASYSMEFLSYLEVPKNVLMQIIGTEEDGKKKK
jgi:elongation factor G